MGIDPRLLEILVCPRSRAPLKEVEDGLVSTDPDTRMRYRVEEGIPIMLVGEGQELSLKDWKRAMGHD